MFNPFFSWMPGLAGTCCQRQFAAGDFTAARVGINIAKNPIIFSFSEKHKN